VLSRLPKLAIVISLACSIGLHWTFFQSLAWVGMVVSYSQDAPLTEALVKTFDGKHPCELCKEIAKGKQSEKKSEFPLQLKKFEFLAVKAQFLFAAPTNFWRLVAADDYLKSILFAPPTPPPRSVLL
jgi:hypothetical protein